MLKKFEFADSQFVLYNLFLMSLTVTGIIVPGITAKLVETPVFKLVKTKAKTSLKAHWYSPYSFEANKKSKLKLSPNSQAQYIGFFNTVWLIVNDIILGFAIKKSLIENKAYKKYKNNKSCNC